MPWPWHSAKLGIPRISSFAECQGQGTRQIFFKKKILCRVPHDLAPGKEITKKIKKTLCRVPPRCDTRQRNYKKNKKNLCRVPPRHGTRQRKFEKKIKKSLPGASDMAPGKARDDGAGAVTTTFLCRVPGLHSAKSLPSAR